MLRWPNRGEVHGANAAPGGNQYYQDLTKFTWSDARATLEFEAVLLKRVGLSGDPATEEEAVGNELDAVDCLGAAPSLWGLDLGVAAAVVTLSAVGAVPVASCNGGAFGAPHIGSNPYIAFFIRPRRLLAVLDWAREAGLSLTATTDGIAVLHARCISDFHTFVNLALEAQRRR